MTYVIIAATVLAFAEIIILILFDRQARKKEKTVKQWHSYEDSRKAYNRAHGLPDDAI